MNILVALFAAVVVFGIPFTLLMLLVYGEDLFKTSKRLR